MCTDFEKQLCERIRAICAAKGHVPEKEVQLQHALAAKDNDEILDALDGKVDKQKNCCKGTGQWPTASGDFLVCCEKKGPSVSYQETGVSVGLLGTDVAFNKYIRRYFQEKYEDQINLKTDLFFSKDQEGNLLEIKFPRFINTSGYDARWHYLQGQRGNFEGTTPFSAPICVDKYHSPTARFLTDTREGAMFVDFLRLLQNHLGQIQRKQPEQNLYFAAFFKKDDFCNYSRACLEKRVCNLLKYYMEKSFKFVMTRGNRNVNGDWIKRCGVDIWPSHKPDDIHFFCEENNDAQSNVVKMKFQDVCDVTDRFKVLSEGESLVAFLLKITPPGVAPKN